MSRVHHPDSGETWTVLYRGPTARTKDHVIYRVPSGEIGECSGGLFDHMTRPAPATPDAPPTEARPDVTVSRGLRLRLLEHLWAASLVDASADPREAARLFDALAALED